MRAALYARYSTELQSADSIQDQFRVIQRLAEQHKFEIVERFSDAAISGGTSARPGYQAMLAAARTGAFEVILAEDSSRLWRQLAEQWRAIAELTDLGVHVVTKDVDTRSDNYKLLLSMHGAMADAYRDQIAYRTKRGLEGKARNQRSTGGRAYGYMSARDSGTGDREIHPEQAEVVRQIFQWYADGKSPRWIAGELNDRGVPSPGASWNRTSERLNAKRRRGWVPTAIHGDAKRGTGILHNTMYAGQVIWGRSVWKRSAADSKNRKWNMATDQAQVVRYTEERLRIVPQDLWDRVQARQKAVSIGSVAIRGALAKRGGRLPKHVLSGILTCEKCGAAYTLANAREYTCSSFRGGGDAACSNGLRVRIDLAESRLLKKLNDEILSDEGIALLQKLLRGYMRQAADEPKPVPKSQAAAAARKQQEIDQLMTMMKSGTLSQSVASVAIEKAQADLAAIEQAQPDQTEKQVDRVIRMLPRAAEELRERMTGGALGLRDPRSIVQARNTVFGMFGGKVPLRPANTKIGERPFLIARISLNRQVLLDAATANCRKLGSGGRI